MALIKCPECGRENVSDSAESCPNCGYGIKAHFKKSKEAIFVLLLDPLDYNKSANSMGISHMIFSDGIEDGAKGKLNYKEDYDYWVEGKHLFTQQRGYKETQYIIDGDCLINSYGICKGDLPDGEYFSVDCTKPCAYDSTLTDHIIFSEDGTFIEKTDGKIGVSGTYIRKGNLIAKRSKNSNNHSYCYLIYKRQHCAFVYTRIGSTILEEAKALCSELDKKPYDSQSVGIPATGTKEETSWQQAVRKTNEANGITCPYCKSMNCSKIGTMSRGLSFGLFGFGSSKVGKQWHCNNCKSNF